MRVTTGWIPFFAAAALAACDNSPLVGPDAGDGVRVEIGVDSVLMTGPGSIRVAVEIGADGGGVIESGDSLAKEIRVTGPFSATWDPANRRYYRNLVVTATGPGEGTLIVRASATEDTIPLRAVALSFKAVSVAPGFACGLSTDDRAWCWGDNRSSQLGASTPGDCVGGSCQYGGGQHALTPIPANNSQAFTKISVGGAVCTFGFGPPQVCGGTCAITPAGNPVCWGQGASSTLISSPSTVSSLAVGPSISAGTPPKYCGVLTSGQGYCFGSSSGGAIGGSLQYASIDVGRYHACGLRNDGDIYCWGSNARGNLGIGSTDAQDHPTPELVVAPEKFTAVEVSDYITCGLGVSGKIYCWGIGYSATGASPPPACPGVNAVCQVTPRVVEGGTTYTQLSLSNPHSAVCGLTAAGAVDCWNSYNVVPAAISLSQPLQSISVGAPDMNGYFAALGCGVSTTNVAWCWSPAGSSWKVGQ